MRGLHVVAWVNICIAFQEAPILCTCLSLTETSKSETGWSGKGYTRGYEVSGAQQKEPLLPLCPGR